MFEQLGEELFLRLPFYMKLEFFKHLSMKTAFPRSIDQIYSVTDYKRLLGQSVRVLDLVEIKDLHLAIKKLRSIKIFAQSLALHCRQ